MKNIIDVELKTRKVDFSQCKGAIGQLLKLGDFKAKEGTNAIVYGNDKIGARRILLVGLGEKKKTTLDTVRKAASSTAKKSVEMRVESISLALHRAFGGRFDLSAMGRAAAEGIYLGSYRYDEFVTGAENGRLDCLKVEIIDSDSVKTRKLNKGLSSGLAIGKAQSYARTLANRPANVINPAKLAAAAKELARGLKRLDCTVFDEKQLAAKGMGGVLAVGSGSQNKPRFIVLKYNPASKAASRQPTVALVGKAITFDSGGISIKPAEKMNEMKLDKTGGITVLATMKAVAELGPPVNVYGIIPSAENLPSGTSYRPGDIITTFSGKTVEVQNTDAEGRMILCDALSYAVRQNCGIIIDVATLTGACKVALGKYMAGLMGNDERLVKQLQRAAKDSGEKVWPMPSGDEYAEEMKSKIADLKNIGSKWGGACTAAAFLRQFVGDAKWAHLDIAGTEMFDRGTEFAVAGSSGFGVRLLTTYLMNLAGKKT
ncbi:MAG: leucyl aminopeptidase [Planctomycetota bacterium]|jgi:leucyl aminopeptidase